MEEKTATAAAALEPQQTVQTPVVEAVNASVSAQSAGNKGGSGMKIVLIVLFLALIAGAGGYLYFNMQNSAVNKESQKQVEDQTMTALENEVNGVDTGSDTEGFSAIDQDLQSL
ncbi:hypothetical protein HYW46_02065 [Candidatus Daviesbacteria bacterium]|nr:hypothetical protein [Candidatus Daviesbacteria bacterium]